MSVPFSCFTDLFPPEGRRKAEAEEAAMDS